MILLTTEKKRMCDMTSEQCISMSRITVTKGKRLILNDISWCIPFGKSTMVVGGIGSGRKELFELFAGYDNHNSGRIKKNGKHAVVTEHFPMLRGFSVKDYLTISLAEEIIEDSLIRIKAVLEKYDLWEKREFEVEYLSLEERCYLQLAMADVQCPDVVLLEQCWRYLPMMPQNKFLKCIKQRIQEENITFVLFVDNRDKELENYFEEVVRIEHGVILTIKEENRYVGLE